MLGAYRLIEKIGEGGFSTVWRAEQLEPIRRQVAVKILKRGLDTEDCQPHRSVTVSPLLQIGQGPDAVELAEVEEVDQGRSTGQQGSHLAWVGPDPDGIVGKLGCGYVFSERQHGRSIVSQVDASRNPRKGSDRVGRREVGSV